MGLGQQLFALANDCDTYQMSFGHRGQNYPVKEKATGRIDMTSQSHIFAVKKNSLDRKKSF